jgi:hypothetical protein
MSNPIVTGIGAMKVVLVMTTMYTLDDHDYGFQNADRSNLCKDLSKEYFMDFFQKSIQDQETAKAFIHCIWRVEM